MAAITSKWPMIWCFMVVSLCEVSDASVPPEMQAMTVSEVEQKLHDYLLTNNSAVLALKPYCHDGSTEVLVGQMAKFRKTIQSRKKSEMHVDIEVKIRQLLGVNERDQIVNLQLLFTAMWTDCRLHWNVSEYPIKSMFFDSSALEELNLFIPPITVLEQIEPPFSLREAANIWLYPKRFVIRKLYIAKFACDLDVRLYPFDTQSCKITVGPIDDSLRSLNISEAPGCDGPCDATSWHVSTQVLEDTWTMVMRRSVWTAINVRPCSPEQLKNESIDHDAECYMASLEHQILLRRQPAFQLLNLLFPVSISVILSSFVFLMPPGKGDKMGLSLTILLTLFVYTQVMYETLPDTGRTIPLLSQYFLICIYLVTFSCVMSVFGDVLDGQSMHVPAVVTKILLRYVGPIILPALFKQRTQNLALAAARASSANQGAAKAVNSGDAASADFDCLEPIQLGDDEHQNKESRKDWILLSAVFDRCFFWLHLFTTVAVLLAYLIYGYVEWLSFGEKLQ